MLKIAGALLAWLAITIVQFAMFLVIMGIAFALGSLVVEVSGFSSNFGRGKTVAIVVGLVLLVMGLIALELGLKKLSMNWLRISQNPLVHLNFH